MVNHLLKNEKNIFYMVDIQRILLFLEKIRGVLVEKNENRKSYCIFNSI
jgi:hypothetical protein